jgi:glyoxylase-like metal-dependent hydrolase (beta-lactamase superfamily II)
MQKELAEGIYFIEGQDDMIPDSNVYVLADASGEDLTLVDAGLVGKSSYKLESIQRLGLEIDHIKRIIMTHTHLDHFGCVPEILERVPGAELWVHVEEADPLEQGDDRILFGMPALKDMCLSQLDIRPETFFLRADRKLRDEETLNLGGEPWQVVHIPGHSPGCIALYNASKKILIPGDVVYADYAIGRFDLHGADPAAHKASLYRLSRLEVDMLLPGHNRVMEAVPPGYIEETVTQWEEYM